MQSFDTAIEPLFQERPLALLLAEETQKAENVIAAFGDDTLLSISTDSLVHLWLYVGHHISRRRSTASAGARRTARGRGTQGQRQGGDAGAG
jgi:hypothetical protein